ncbi:hypothetical protein [Flavobacterium sp.]|uniref:hypothetical protein n=1 Tax=Flavobacterium sp. TaxID=239 RepID=UPI00374D9D6E
MKKMAIVLILTLSLISCSNTDKAKGSAVSHYYGKWTLVKISGNKINAETTGSKMDWQENYVFNTDGTFVKTRVTDKITTTSSGTFIIEKKGNTIGFALTHKESSTIIGNCMGDLSEFLSINEDNLLQSSWQMCDGPGLLYKKS